MHTPKNHPLTLQVSQADGSYSEVFNITSRSSNCVTFKSELTMFNGAKFDLRPFAGVEKNKDGSMTYVIGVNKADQTVA